MEEELDPVLSIENAFYEARMFVEFGAAQLPHAVYLAGRFKLLERIGKGSYGKVFLAEDRELARQVAVKLMPVGDPAVAHREGTALAALKHPNVVRIYDHGSKDDYRWLVLELLEGTTLDKWSKDQEPRALLARYLEAGEGLGAAHGCGLVHRDFKPGNVLVTEGKAVVVDFGLARNLESWQGEGEVVERIQGTTAYLAPECLMGRRGDERSDQFAFCVALWEALCGENPFERAGDDMAARALAVLGRPRGAEKVPRRLRAPLLRGMATAPGERWPTMAKLLEELEGRAQPRGLRGVVMLVSVVMLLGAGGLAWSQVPKAPSSAAEEEGLSEASLAALKGLRADDSDAVVSALRTGYPIALREGTQGEFVKVVVIVAVGLEAKGNNRDAVHAWWMVVHLSRECGEGKQADAAAVKVQELAAQLGPASD